MKPSNAEHVIKSLHDNLDLLSGPLGVLNPQDIPIYNISNALIGMYQDFEAEFKHLHARLTALEGRMGGHKL